MLTLVFLDFKLDEMSVTQLKSNCVSPVKLCMSMKERNQLGRHLNFIAKKKDGDCVQVVQHYIIKLKYDLCADHDFQYSMK